MKAEREQGAVNIAKVRMFCNNVTASPTNL